MNSTKLLDIEDESDENLNNRIKENLYKNSCNILTVILTCVILLIFIITSIDYYLKEELYTPYNINIDNNNYYVTWNTKKKISCKLLYYFKENKYVSVPKVTYKKNIFIYKSYIDQINYKTLYNSIINCKYDNVIYKSGFFNFRLNP